MAENVQFELGDRLKQERVRLGLTQDEAARACGITKDMWSKYERNLYRPKKHVIASFAEEFGANAHYISTGSAIRDEKTIQSYDEGMPMLIRAYHLASPAVKAAMVQVVRAMSAAQESHIQAVSPTFVQALVTGGQIRQHTPITSDSSFTAVERALIQAYETSDDRKRYLIWLALDCPQDMPDDAVKTESGVTRKMIRLVDCYRQSPERTQYMVRLAANVDDYSVNGTQLKSVEAR